MPEYFESCFPYVSAFQIYQDKITDDIEEFDNESMRQGRDLEAYVAQRFTEQTGKKVKRANAIFQSDENPFMLADFDRLIVGERAGLECKTVSAYNASYSMYQNGREWHGCQIGVKTTKMAFHRKYEPRKALILPALFKLSENISTHLLTVLTKGDIFPISRKKNLQSRYVYCKDAKQ